MRICRRRHQIKTAAATTRQATATMPAIMPIVVADGPLFDAEEANTGVNVFGFAVTGTVVVASLVVAARVVVEQPTPMRVA